MKILLLTPVPPDRGAPGAIPALVHAALVGLAERNDVTLVTAAGPDLDELVAVDRLREDGLRIHSVPRHLDPRRWARRARMARWWLGGRVPWRTVWFHEPGLQRVLDQLLAEQHFDVVAVEDNSMAMYQLDTSAATILTEHEVRDPRSVQWRPGSPRQWPAWAFREADWHRWRRYQRRTWQRFDTLQVFTERDAQMVGELRPNSRHRVRHALRHRAPGHDRSPSTVDSNAIAFLGNYTHPPNVDAAVWLACDVLPRVRRRVPAAHLRLAGIHAPSVVRDLASSCVDVVGVVDDADAFLRRHAVVAAPIRTGGGMRMKVLHAMALGAAVVTTPRGAEGLQFVDAPPLAIAEGADDLASAIVRLLLDEHERRALGVRARAFVEMKHSPTAIARRLEAVYASVIEARLALPQ